MARKARKSKKGGSLSVNFKGVETRKRLPEDDYAVKPIEAERGESDAGNDQIAWVFQVSRGEYKGAKLYYYTGLADNQLWKLANLLAAMGMDVPDDEMDLDLEQIIEDAPELVAVVAHDTWQGEKRAKMVDVDHIDNFGGDAGEDEPKKGKKKSAKDDDEDDEPKKGKKSRKAKEPEKLDRDDVEAMDRDELEGLITEHDLDVDPDSKAMKKDAKLLEAVLEALEEKELLADEEPAPKKGRGKSKDDDDEPKSKKGKGKKKTYDSDTIADMDEDDLQEVIDDNSLDVDLDDFKTLRKKAAAVIDALEEAGQIE